VPKGRSGSIAERYERGYRRSLRIGLLVSAILHALLILVVSRQLYIGARHFRTIELPPRPPVGLRVIDVSDIVAESAVEEVIELPEEHEDQIQRPEPPTDAEGRPVPAAGADEGPGLTNAERLRTREGDPRLWEDFTDRPLPIYLEDRFAQAEGVIRARLGAVLDSLELSEEERRRAVEWLMGEGDQQWGVTPDGLVLGGMVIPMNVGALFEPEGPLGRELRQRARDLADIQRQDFATDVERVQRERVEEMRQRSQEEAARRSADTTAAPADSASAGDGRAPRD
jgi:hypothetical protein